MRKTLACFITFILLLSLFSTFTTVSAEENAYDAAQKGDVLYTANFNGEPGVFEPGTYSGMPDAYVKDGGTSVQLIAMEDATATMWGGEIKTLPLNDKTQYTIYYSVTRTAGDGSGLYVDGVYGVYGYNNRCKIHEGKSGLSGRAYTYFEEEGMNLTLPETGTITQEYALEVNGANATLAHYIKDDTGEFVLIQASYPYDGIVFQSEYLGLYFYTYYADHMSVFSNCYVVKGLSFAVDERVPENVPEGCVNTKLELGEKTRKLDLITASKHLDEVFYAPEGEAEPWDGIRMGVTDGTDPSVTLDWASYLYKAYLDSVDSQVYPFVAFKLKVVGYVSDFELFYCAGEIRKPTAGYSELTYYGCESNGEVEYILFDLTEMCEGDYNRLRLDINGSEAGTEVYLYEVALFATEQEALVYMGLIAPDEEPTTEEETETATEQVTEQKTEPTTEATGDVTTEAAATQEKKSGCGAIVGAGMITVCLVALGAACINKKKD